jgi:hypothetical protein
MNETNWVSQSASPTVTESDRKGLEKAHRYEARLEKKGYRWYTINSRTKILVECDKDGNPTQRGKQQIKRAQENCGIMK